MTGLEIAEITVVSVIVYLLGCCGSGFFIARYFETRQKWEWGWDVFFAMIWPISGLILFPLGLSKKFVKIGNDWEFNRNRKREEAKNKKKMKDLRQV